MIDSIVSWKPLNDRIVVLPRAHRKVTEGDIILSDTGQNQDTEIFGEVLAVGPGRMLESGIREDLPIKKGDIVLFGKYAGDDFTVYPDGHIVPFGDMGIVPPDAVLVKIFRIDAILAILPHGS